MYGDTFNRHSFILIATLKVLTKDIIKLKEAAQSQQKVLWKKVLPYYCSTLKTGSRDLKMHYTFYSDPPLAITFRDD